METELSSKVYQVRMFSQVQHYIFIGFYFVNNEKPIFTLGSDTMNALTV